MVAAFVVVVADANHSFERPPNGRRKALSLTLSNESVRLSQPDQTLPVRAFCFIKAFSLAPCRPQNKTVQYRTTTKHSAGSCDTVGQASRSQSIAAFECLCLFCARVRYYYYYYNHYLLSVSFASNLTEQAVARSGEWFIACALHSQAHVLKFIAPYQLP